MNTIKGILEAAKVLGTDFIGNINGIEITRHNKCEHWTREYISKANFILVCQKKHLQTLKEMGVSIHFFKISEISQGNGNDISTTASCTLDVLESLEKYTRHNHLRTVNICNYYDLGQGNWMFRKSKLVEAENLYLKEHLDNIESIHKAVRRLNQGKHIFSAYQEKCKTKRNIT